MKSYLLSVLGFFLFLINTNSQTIISGGEVSGVWSSSNSPYWIQGDIEVPENSSLIIQPGTFIEFQGHYKLQVKGFLSAVGTISDSIFFTVDDTTNFYNIDIPDGGWEGIELTNEYNPDTSLLAYCNIRFTKPYGTTSTNYYGRVVTLFYSNKIRITNCRLSDNKGHLLGGAIGSLEGSYVYLANSLIQNCESTWGGGGIHCIGSTVEIINNTFFSNKSMFDGGAIKSTGSTITISNNIISNNYTIANSGKGGGIDLYNCEAFLVNNIICNNLANEGGGIHCWNGNYTILNNTITNNRAFVNGGGIYTNNSAVIEIMNSIVWGNAADYATQIYGGSNTTVSYCDVQDGFSGTGIANIDANPEFISPSFAFGTNYNGLEANWELKCYSPCINIGSPDTSNLPIYDLNNNPRIIDSIVDMGAYEFQDNSTPLIINGFVYYNENTIDTGYVKLFEYTYKSQMKVIDSVVVSDTGYYQFEAVCHGQYIVCAYPDTSLYPQALRTYYGDAYYWEDAIIISYADDTTNFSADINLLNIEFPTGENSIMGVIQTDELSPLPDIDVLLETSSDNIMGYVQTNSNGVYDFYNIPEGNYRILVDIPGLPMDSIHELFFSKSNFSTKENYNYLVNDSNIYIDATTHMESLILNNDINLFPNPCKGQFTINDWNSKTQIIDVKIIDSNGRILTNKTVTNNTTIKCQGLLSGLYFIIVDSGNKRKTFKLLIL